MTAAMLGLLVTALLLAPVQTGVLKNRLPQLSTDEVLRWVSERLEALEVRPTSLSLLENRVAAIELRLTRLETKFDLQMDRLEEVLISRNNQHLEHNQAMQRKLETTSSATVRHIGDRLDTIEDRIGTEAARVTQKLTARLQRHLVCNASGTVHRPADGGSTKETHSGIDPSANIAVLPGTGTKSVASASDRDDDVTDLSELQRQIIRRVETVETQLRSQLQRTEKRFILELAGIDDRLQSCHNYTEKRLNSTQKQLQTLQTNISRELRAVRGMVEQDEAEHAATRHAVYDGQSATMEAVRRGCLAGGRDSSDRRHHRDGTASQGSGTSQPPAASSAIQLEQQLEQISSQLEEGLRWLDDRVREAHDEQNLNLALHASSLRRRLLEVREHLDTTANSIITVLTAAHHNVTAAARATWEQGHHTSTYHYLQQMVEIMDQLVRAVDARCPADRDDDLLRREDLNDLAEVTNDGFGKLQLQVAELTEDLRELSTEAQTTLGR